MTEEQEKEIKKEAEKEVVHQIIQRSHSIHSNRQASSMSKLEKCGLEEFAFKRLFIDMETSSQVARDCNKILKDRGIEDITIKQQNISYWLHKIKKHILNIQPSELAQKVSKSLKLLDSFNNKLDNFDETIDSYIENDALWDPIRLDNVMKIFAMWKETVNLTKSMLESRLPHPPINVETLRHTLRRFGEFINDCPYLDKETKGKLLLDIKKTIINNFEVVIDGKIVRESLNKHEVTESDD